MDLKIRVFRKDDAEQISLLDRKWFGDYGIVKDEFEKYIEKHPDRGIVILQADTVKGFATFEILEKSMPHDYVGEVPHTGKVLFLSNFTTVTNYRKEDWSVDEVLLRAVEKKAHELECSEIWEALSQDHPYNKENNPHFDAYGFYLSHGFSMDQEKPLVWKPNNDIMVPCWLFRKKV